MNLCMPGEGKSCAACCGLYNVRDGTRPTLRKKLETRTLIFHHTDRTPEALLEFEEAGNRREKDLPLDPAIHVCAFTGFIDSDMRTPGCMLHPSAPGNGGIDLRGLCYYGSLACKTFFCPAWEELDPVHLNIVFRSIDDWHLYGLVVTDAVFVRSLFAILEGELRIRMEPDRLSSGGAFEILKEMLAWKDSWPLRGASLVRNSRYYVKGGQVAPDSDMEIQMNQVLLCLGSTSKAGGIDPGREVVARTVERFVASY